MSLAPGQVARCLTRAQIGLTAPLVEVEVHLGSGLPTFFIVGLAATAVKESKERVRAALLNAHCEFPAGRITVNLAPADLPKDGGRFDLPIALGILAASGQLDPAQLRRSEFYGELGLGGELKSVRGLLLAATQAARDGHRMILPRGDADEALLLGQGEIYAASHLREVREHLSGHRLLGRCVSSRISGHAASTRSHADLRSHGIGDGGSGDVADVRGQRQAKRALLVAAAGAHSLLMMGPPGSGKSMLAQRLPSLLPSLPPADALEVASIAAVSAQGFDPRRWGQRPFRAPHHTASAQALIGGGPRAQPGEVSLAHHGVLFLDEFPEFDRRVLEALREPLEAGSVAVSRAAMQAVYPARFQLVAAMNPCPCGWHGSLGPVCRCAPSRIARYRERLSGPLLDRIDLRIEVSPVPQEQLMNPGPPERHRETSYALAARVRVARDLQFARAGKLNFALEGAELERWCALDARSRRLLERSRQGAAVTARSVHRLMRIARTVADLEESATIAAEHVADAVQLRRALG